jgi:PST family polysaccharide transporter
MISQDSNTAKVMKGLSSQTLVTIVLGVVEIVSFSIMSRLLTQEDFGYYAAITAITVVFATFSETGIGSAIVQQKELTKRYVDNAFTISLVFGSFISFLLFVLADPLSRMVADVSMRTPLMLMSGTLLLNCLTSVNKSLMHRKLQFMLIGMINLVSLVITTGIAIWLAYLGLGYYAIIAKAILGSVITFFLSLVFCKTRLGLAFDIQTFKKIFSFSGWLMASSLFRNLSHQIDKLLMPKLLSINALGAYNRPKDFVEQISSKINGIFDSALFPVLSGIQDNRIALNSAFRRSLYLMNAFALLITMGFMFNSGLLIRIFFGEQWVALRDVMFVVSCSLLFDVDGRLADCYLRSLGMTKQQFLFRVFEFLLKTTGIFIGFRWGIMGVAISILITNSIAKIVKIVYIGGQVDIKASSVISIILSSWRYAVLMLPICILAYVSLPNTWGGGIAMVSVYSLVTIVLFVFMPQFVGKQYKEDVYLKIVSIVKKRFHIQ